ncbi:hypothetical protein ACHAO4_005810 [Trichoderma viride]
MAAPPWPSPTKTWHDDTYPAIDPTRPELSLAGKTAVITGGGIGIGGAIAQSFAKAGVSHLALIGRRLQVLEEKKAQISIINPQTEVLLLQADIVDGDQIQKAFETVKSTFGEPQILVNNAAYFDGTTSVLKDSVDDWYQAFDVNVKGSLHVARSFLSVAAPSPRILNVSSAQAHLDAKLLPGMSAYLSSKMAQLRMFEAIQVERPDVVIVSCHPGRVMSEMSAKIGRKKGIDTLDLSGDFGVWAVSDEAAFLKGRMAWVNWDITELKEKKDEIINDNLFIVSLSGWPFNDNATELHDELVAVSPATHDRQFTFQTSTEIMTGRGGGGGRRVLLPPINMIFKLLQNNATVSVWLYEQLSIRIEGKIRGFDEFMNLVIDDAVEVKQITKTNDKESRKPLGQILLKGDNVSLIQNLSS